MSIEMLVLFLIYTIIILLILTNYIKLFFIKNAKISASSPTLRYTYTDVRLYGRSKSNSINKGEVA